MNNASVPHTLMRAEVGVGAHILQRQELLFKRLFIDRPILILVEHGSKTVRAPHAEVTVHAGDGIALPGGQAFDVINHVAADGSYRAHWLAWEDDLLRTYNQSGTGATPIRTALPLRQLSEEMQASFRRAMQALERTDIPLYVAQARLGEVLLWLASLGSCFMPSIDANISSRVRRLLNRELAKNWTATEVATALAMSEASLRRKLAEDGTSFSEILLDTRMSSALALLQSSVLPITQIALQLGYQTPSHFSARFRERFGFPPTAIRKTVSERLVVAQT